MISVPRPADMNGRQLADELRAAGFNLTDWSVVVVGEELHISGVDETQRDAVVQVVAAHVPTADEERTKFRASVVRLRELRDKGWANLTAADRNEVLMHLAIVMLYLRRAD